MLYIRILIDTSSYRVNQINLRRCEETSFVWSLGLAEWKGSVDFNIFFPALSVRPKTILCTCVVHLILRFSSPWRGSPSFQLKLLPGIISWVLGTFSPQVQYDLLDSLIYTIRWNYAQLIYKFNMYFKSMQMSENVSRNKVLNYVYDKLLQTLTLLHLANVNVKIEMSHAKILTSVTTN